MSQSNDHIDAPVHDPPFSQSIRQDELFFNPWTLATRDDHIESKDHMEQNDKKDDRVRHKSSDNKEVARDYTLDGRPTSQDKFATNPEPSEDGEISDSDRGLHQSIPQTTLHIQNSTHVRPVPKSPIPRASRAATLTPVESAASTSVVKGKRKRQPSFDEPQKRMRDAAQLLNAPPVIDTRREQVKKLMRQKCMVQINKKNMFGRFDRDDAFQPIVSLDPGPPDYPSISLVVLDPQGKCYYKNKSGICEWDNTFAVEHWEVFQAKHDPRPRQKPSDRDPLTEVPVEQQDWVIGIRFRSWTKINGWARYRGQDDQVLEGHPAAIKRSMALLCGPREPFEISIWFTTHRDWLDLQNTVFCHFYKFFEGRIDPVLRFHRPQDVELAKDEGEPEIRRVKTEQDDGSRATDRLLEDIERDLP